LAGDGPGIPLRSISAPPGCASGALSAHGGEEQNDQNTNFNKGGLIHETTKNCNGQQHVGKMTVNVYVILRSAAEPVLSEAEGKNPVSGKHRPLFCTERDPSRSLS
jgi:hypothetical protein